MPRVSLDVERSALVVVDVQPKFMKAVHEAERVVERTRFLVRIAKLLGVPVVGTVQNPERMGGLDDAVLEHIPGSQVLSKMSFSCCGAEGFGASLGGRDQIVLVGVETHICVCLTANDLLDQGLSVVVCPDAVSSRTMERHKLGMERIRDAGAIPSHSETVAYEWMGMACHPRFKEALQIVKELS
jgi:nicotinamidase-related amidase